MPTQNHNNYHQLLQFTPFFESNEPKYTVENELSFDPFRYSEKFYEFIMLASEMLVIVGFDWHSFTEEQHITTRENLAEQVKGMDFETIRKWITTITRQERYCSGTYAQMIDQGVFLAMLQRIKQLLDNGSIQTP